MTAWELDPKVIVDLAADRAPFIDQTQSMSLSISNPTAELMVRTVPCNCQYVADLFA